MSEYRIIPKDINVYRSEYFEQLTNNSELRKQEEDIRDSKKGTVLIMEHKGIKVWGYYNKFNDTRDFIDTAYAYIKEIIDVM